MSTLVACLESWNNILLLLVGIEVRGDVAIKLREKQWGTFCTLEIISMQETTVSRVNIVIITTANVLGN